jgi:hypothetical protein
MVVVAVLLGGVLMPLAMRHQMEENDQTVRYLRAVEEALIGFAAVEGRLPWPDTDIPPDGVENPVPANSSPCAACEGLLPWRTIGISATDPWGRICRYRVTREFAAAAQPGFPPATNRFDLFDRGDVRINARIAHSPEGSARMRVDDIVLTDDAAAAVVSSGRNGAGGWRLDGTALEDPPIGSDERINADGADPEPPYPHFYAGPVAAAAPFACDARSSRNCAFDDRVVWIPSAVLIKAMLDAGRLP